MFLARSLSFFIIVLVGRTKVLSFNIETRQPIEKKHEKDTYFGFSVAQHVVTEGSSNPDDYWILVGAPLGKNLQPNTKRSGALFKCRVNETPDDCEQVETDGRRFDSFDYGDEVETDELKPPDETQEIKENQWLGVTVKSQKPGGAVVVCAHRYIQSYNTTLHHYGMGLCYLLSRDLVTKEAVEPCKGRPMEKLHQQYGYCQAGTSLAALEDDYVLMGAPGPYTWRGTIFVKNIVESYNDRDHTIYKGPLNDNPTPIDKYSYLGMSVTGGNFFIKKNKDPKKDVPNYVAGAPRSHNTGEVFIFNRTKQVEDLDIVLIIKGQQFASSFGYEILAVDIDNDGYDELLVAAPFYYDDNKGGAVYIYNNIRNCNFTSCPISKNFTGKSESRFGFAMTSLGDINKDGYVDVAIGAPYEGEGGAVYIYLGKKGGLLSDEPSQVIRPPPHQGSYGIKTMGYSLSGGIDMDLNDYPDLLVGAYESDRVILYKTRPIIDITITVKGDELRNINASRKGCAGDPNANKTCFSFETCFVLSNFRFTQNVELKYEIKELAKKIPRVSFRDENNIKYITPDSNGKGCIPEVAYLNEANGDIWSPIKFLVNYTIHNDVVGSPILNKTSVKEFSATFQKNCGEDEVCHSNLTLNAGILKIEESDEGFILDMGKNKELVLNANVTNYGEPAYEAKLYVMHPKGLSYIALQAEKNATKNISCTSNNESTIVTCNLGNPFQQNQFANLRLRFEIADTQQEKLNLSAHVNSTSNETSIHTKESFTVILQKIASYILKGEGKPQNIFYSGKVKGASAMKHLEDIGPKVIHSYEIINQGTWNIRNMQVVIQWPYQVFTQRKEGGKWLLYLEKEPTIDFSNENRCTVEPRSAINPLRLNSSGIIEDEEVTEAPTERRRRKRDVEEVIKPETVKGSDGTQRKIVTMDCNKGTALCATITCTIARLSENSQIKINIPSRIWNSTLIEDYSSVDWVTIRSVARAFITDASVKHSNDAINASLIETKAHPEILAADKGVNIWVIIGAVLAGLFLLILVILVLYKCGFFKRNRIKDHTLSGNLKKQGESETLLKEGEGKSKVPKS